jgi:ribosomal protein S18 acetylase RimI-like enzyme
MDIKIRKAKIDDMNDLHQCNKRNLPLYYSVFDYGRIILSPDNLVYVAETNGKIVGYIYAKMEESKNNIHIYSFAIDKQFRRRKIGTLLIEEIKKLKTMSLYVHIENKNAIAFYKGNGFKVEKVKKNYYLGSLSNVESFDAYYMMK